MRTILALGCVLSFGLCGTVQAAQDGDARVKLPWDQIKHLLNIDSDQVRLSWDEFNALLRRTSSTSTPNFSVSGGNVVLTREEFKRLVDSLIAPTAQVPSSFITKAAYNAKLIKDSLVVNARLNVHIRNKQEKPLEIDLFPSYVGFHEVLINDRKALIQEKNGRLFVSIDREGHHQIQLKFSVPQSQHVKQEIQLPVVRTPITTVSIEIPEKQIDIHVRQALQIESRAVEGGTIVEAVLPPTEQVQAYWFPMAPASEKGPARIYSNADHLLMVEEDGLRVKSVINVQVLKNTINELRIELPQGFDVIDARGDMIAEWKEVETPDRILVLPFKYARQGNFQVEVLLEQIWSNNKVTSRFPGLKVKGAVTEKGFIGVELRTQAEITPQKTEGIDAIDIRELPPHLVAQAQRPLLYGYRFVGQPFELGLDVERHGDVPLLSSFIDRAVGNTWLLEDGQIIHHLSFELRNSWKPFMELTLPKGSQLWSAFVSGSPVKPTINEKGNLLIPLNRSYGGGGELAPFTVEIVCYQKAKPLFWLGRSVLEYPVPDLMVSELEWITHLPPEHHFTYVGRELEKGISRPLHVANAAGIGGEFELDQEKQFAFRDLKKNLKVKAELKEVGGKDGLKGIVEEYDKRDGGRIIDSVDLAEKPASSAEQSVLLEISPRRRIDGRVAGVFPIRVNIPVEGSIQQFSKSVVISNKPVKLTFVHASNELFKTLKWLLALIGLFGFVTLGRRYRPALVRALIQLRPIAKNQLSRTTPVTRMVGAALVLIASSYFSGFWIVLGISLFLFTLTQWITQVLRQPIGEKI